VALWRLDVDQAVAISYQLSIRLGGTVMARFMVSMPDEMVKKIRPQGAAGAAQPQRASARSGATPFGRFRAT